MLKVLSYFAGIGAPEKALQRLGIEHEVINYCEIDKHASRSYSIIHGIPEEKNLWDVTGVDIETLEDFDLLTHGSPCQDYSVGGKRLGGDKGSGTRSSLMWNTVEVIRRKKPKYVIWENVKGVLDDIHIHNYRQYIDDMEEIGYYNYGQILTAIDYGVPHNRERIFVVSVRMDIDNGYEFPKPIKLEKRLKDILQKRVLERHYLPEKYLKNMVILDRNKPKIADLFYSKHEQSNRVWNIEYWSNTLQASSKDYLTKTKILTEDERVRTLTPLECIRLTGFDDEDYVSLIENGVEEKHIYKQTGNSIVVQVLEAILDKLLINTEKEQLTIFDF